MKPMTNAQLDQFVDVIDKQIEAFPDDVPDEITQMLTSSIMMGAIFRMLTEIAKRLPEPLQVPDAQS